MAVKPVIDIDIRDEKFRKFKELYDKWQDTLGKIPDAFGKAGDAQDRMSKGFESMSAALMAQLDLAKSLDEEDEKRLKRLAVTENLWTSIRTSAQSTSRHILEIGRGLLGLGGLAVGAAAGGLYALDKLGNAAGDMRRSATGRGLSIGQENAFTNSFGRFVDANSVLSGVSAAQSDISKQGSLWSIGVNPNQDVAALALDTMRHVRALVQMTPVNQLGILESSRHLDQLGYGVEDLRRIKGTGNAEWDRQMATYQSGVGALGLRDDTAEKWQDFIQKLEAAGKQIELVLIDKLAPLAGPVGDLSKALVDFAGRVANNPEVGKGITTFAEWIKQLSGDVSKPEFLAKMNTFVTDMSVVAGDFHKVFGWLNAEHNREYGWIDKADNGISAGWDWAKNAWRHLVGADTGYFQDLIKGAASKNGANPALALAIAQNESSMGRHMDTQPGGATGLFQIKPVWSKFFHEDPNDPRQAADMGTKIAAYLDHKYHDLRKELAAYTLGETVFDKATHGGKDANWFDEIPKSAQSYVEKGIKVIVDLHLPPGGSVLTAAQQIAPN